MGSLTITYESPGQAPVSVATVYDEGLLRQAARLAVEQAEREAKAVAAQDPIMGRLQVTEVTRLRAALSILVPGFAATRGGEKALQ